MSNASPIASQPSRNQPPTPDLRNAEGHEDGSTSAALAARNGRARGVRGGEGTPGADGGAAARRSCRATVAIADLLLDAASGISGSRRQWRDHGAGTSRRRRRPAASRRAGQAGKRPAGRHRQGDDVLQSADGDDRWGTATSPMAAARERAERRLQRQHEKSRSRPRLARIERIPERDPRAVTTKASLQLDADFYATTRDDFGDANPHLFGGRLVTTGASALLEMRVDGERQAMTKS